MKHPRPGSTSRLAAILGLLVLGATGACGGHEATAARPARPGAETEWAWLEQAKARLDTKRAQLDALPLPPPAASGALAAPATSPAGSAAAPGGGSPRDRLAREVAAEADDFGRRLVAYINADPPLEAVPLTARQQAAIQMKSDEEIAVAREFISRGGDYRRACEILEAALAGDPRNPRLRDELARARAAQYMSAERFARAAAGMSAAQVSAALGAPNVHDIRPYPDKGVVGWFYPRDAAGDAAACWFETRDGRLTAYLCDWNALAAAAAPPAAPPPVPRPPAAGAPAGDGADGVSTVPGQTGDDG